MTARRILAVLAVLAGGIASVLLFAHGARAAWDYDLALGAGVSVNDNLYLDPEPAKADDRAPVKETFYTVMPALALSWSAPKDSLRADVLAAFWKPEGNADLGSDSTVVGTAKLVWRRWSPLFLEVEDTRDLVPRSLDRADEDYQTRITRNYFKGRTGLTWDFGGTSTLELAYRGELQTFPGEEKADAKASNFGEVDYRQRWTPLWEGRLSLAYGWVRRDLSADYAEFSSALELNQRWSEHLRTKYRLEWRNDVYHYAPKDAPGASSASAWLKGLELNYELAHGVGWTLGYEDRIEGLFDGETVKVGHGWGEARLRSRGGSGFDLYAYHERRKYQDSGEDDTEWGPSGVVRWVLAEGVAVDLGAGWSRIGISEPSEPQVTDEITRAAAGFVVMIGRHLDLQAGYGYVRTTSTEDRRTFDDHRYFALLTVRLQPARPGWLPESWVRDLVAREADVSTAEPVWPRNLGMRSGM